MSLGIRNKVYPDKLLPQQMIVKGVDDILYDIGLSITSIKEVERKRFYHHPIFIFTFMLLFFILKLITLFVKDDNLLAIIGDQSHFLGIKNYFNLALLLWTGSLLSSQIIYYLNHKMGIYPTFIRVFEMLSGSITPEKVGLTTDQDIRKLSKFTKIIFIFFKYNRDYIIRFITFMFHILCYALHSNLNITLMYGLPTSIIYEVAVHHLYSIIVAQLNYFFLLSMYLRIKLKNLNNSLVKGKKEIKNILHTSDALYREINEYNVTYWSKFLLLVWFSFGTPIVLFLNASLFLDILIIRIIMLYVALFCAFLFLLVLNSAASVNTEANKSYKLLNYYLVKILGARYTRKLKVN